MLEQTGYARTTSTPELIPFDGYQDAGRAVEQLRAIYDRNTAFLRDSFAQCLQTGFPRGQRFRACYPAVRLRVDTYQEVDSRLSYGHVVEPGTYMTTITAPELYHDYLLEQLELLIRNHGVKVEIGESSLPIPLHFALNNGVKS
ncbi:MAG: AMP nucleosidase, partial [Alcaligenes sp.]